MDYIDISEQQYKDLFRFFKNKLANSFRMGKREIKLNRNTMLYTYYKVEWLIGLKPALKYEYAFGEVEYKVKKDVFQIYNKSLGGV